MLRKLLCTVVVRAEDLSDLARQQQPVLQHILRIWLDFSKLQSHPQMRV